MINKKTVVILLIIISMIYLLACGNEDQIQGINIFDKDKNYISDYIPEGKTPLMDLLDEDVRGEISVIAENGSVELVSPDAHLDTDRDSVILIDENREIKEVKGIYISENKHSILDAYHDGKAYLDRDEKVMIVLLDGFSYDQYKDMDRENRIPFFSEHFQNEALGVYKPVTNAGFAGMISGENPDVNGVHNRDYRELKVESIFGYAERMGKKSLLLEADIKILNTEIEPILHLDENKDGDIDDEILRTALEVSEEDLDLLFIHFHGIDDRGHSHGPDSEKTRAYIEKIDSYMEELGQMWTGPIVLTSDHGMHETEEGGNHGLCTYEDMIVPYFLREGLDE